MKSTHNPFTKTAPNQKSSIIRTEIWFVNTPQGHVYSIAISTPEVVNTILLVDAIAHNRRPVILFDSKVYLK